MDNTFLQAVVDAVRPRLTGMPVARVWQPSPLCLAIDARLDDDRVLFISARPDAPAMFLANRAAAEADPPAAGELAFGSLLRKHLRGARIEAIRKPSGDRLVTLEFRGFAASGEVSRFEVVAELTGRSSNVLLVDGDGRVRASMRDSESSASRIGRPYAAPAAAAPARSRTLEREAAFRDTLASHGRGTVPIDSELLSPCETFRLYREPSGRFVLSTIELHSLTNGLIEKFDDPSNAATSWWLGLGVFERSRSRVRVLGHRIRAALDRERRAQRAMDDDVRSAEGAGRLREIAECLLAQQSTAIPIEGGYKIVDYYSDGQESIFIEAGPGVTPAALAEQYFARHRRMRRTREAVDSRRPVVESRATALHELESALDAAATTAEIDEIASRLDGLLGIRRVPAGPASRGSGAARPVSGARRFVSSDGYEILVGRTSSANDEITFKVARPSDIWLHAADYPGSHVIVRLARRGDVPHRTLLEAAQLAAFYSQAKDEALVDVRYVQRKFVSKPRGAAPGLVRLHRFKTIAVRPAGDLARRSDA